jgi:hypothetical protein
LNRLADDRAKALADYEVDAAIARATARQLAARTDVREHERRSALAVTGSLL